jgi:hypothetical protein
VANSKELFLLAFTCDPEVNNEPVLYTDIKLAVTGKGILHIGYVMTSAACIVGVPAITRVLLVIGITVVANDAVAA